jgi:hypothetical protein
MAFPPRKKRRYIEKTPGGGGEVDEIWPSLDDQKYHGEEKEGHFRMKGVD